MHSNLKWEEGEGCIKNEKSAKGSKKYKKRWQSAQKSQKAHICIFLHIIDFFAKFWSFSVIFLPISISHVAVNVPKMGEKEG